MWEKDTFEVLIGMIKWNVHFKFSQVAAGLTFR